MDFGEIVTKDGKQYRRYNMQANLDADNPTIRDAARKDPHKKLLHADMPIGEVAKGIPDEQKLEKFRSDIDKNMKT